MEVGASRLFLSVEMFIHCQYNRRREIGIRTLGKAVADDTAGSVVGVISHAEMLMYGKEASNRKQEIDRQHYTIPNQRPKDKHCGKI